MSNPEAHAPAPTAGSPTEEQEVTGRGDGDRSFTPSAPATRGTVAESLADIRADRIIADARREAQAIVDNAKVEARREARVIIESARAEAETIITEAFEQRARIVRRDWAIGDGSWSAEEAEDAGGRDDDRAEPVGAAPERAAGARVHTGETPVHRGESPVPVADAGGQSDEIEAPPEAVPEVAEQPAPEIVAAATAAGAAPDDAWARPDAAPHAMPDVARPPGSEAAPPSVPEVARRAVPDAAAAAKLSELIELPALRSRERLVSVPPRSDAPPGPRPPLPARPRRRTAPGPRGGPAVPPPPPPPPPAPSQPQAPAPPPSAAPAAEAARRPVRPRPRIERELPAGMRIPPDVPDWDDYDDGEER